MRLLFKPKKAKGEYPESLIKAYQKMNELNEKAPRKKFKEERKKQQLKS